MRSGLVEVRLVHSDEGGVVGAPFDEMTIGNKTFFVVEPDEYYQVEVTIYPDTEHHRFDCEVLLCYLKIDGQDVGYIKIVDQTHHGKRIYFRGIRKNDNELCNLKFSPTVLSDYPEEEAPTDGPKNSGLVDAGCFEVSLYESLPPVKADPSMSRYSIHDIPDTKKIDKNKKFWLRP